MHHMTEGKKTESKVPDSIIVEKIPSSVQSHNWFSTECLYKTRHQPKDRVYYR